jgi:hypothetical protein
MLIKYFALPNLSIYHLSFSRLSRIALTERIIRLEAVLRFERRVLYDSIEHSNPIRTSCEKPLLLAIEVRGFENRLWHGRRKFMKITTDLWTSSEFLSKLPIRDTYGIIEIPETSGLIPRVTTGIGESQSDAMPEPGDTPSFGALTTPAPE